ncbi:MAG: ISAzo13-like element transposase-related protein [Terracidiphilus sp.]
MSAFSVFGSLEIKAKLTRTTYPTGFEVSLSELAKLNPTPHIFHGDWNYSVHP